MNSDNVGHFLLRVCDFELQKLELAIKSLLTMLVLLQVTAVSALVGFLNMQLLILILINTK